MFMFVLARSRWRLDSFIHSWSYPGQPQVDFLIFLIHLRLELSTFLKSRTLLSEPNPTDPLMPEIADLYINNQPRVKTNVFFLGFKMILLVHEDS